MIASTFVMMNPFESRYASLFAIFLGSEVASESPLACFPPWHV